MEKDSHRDKLEDFIRSNRTDFDRDKPEKDLWKGIYKQAGQKQNVRKLPVKQFLQMAAVLALGVAIGLVYNVWTNPAETQSMAQVETSKEATVRVTLPPELEEAQSYYSMEVDHKMRQLEALKLDDEAKLEIEFLNHEFEELKKELGETNNQEVITAMIENYRLRLSILENIMEQYQRIEKTEDHEKTSTYL